jgi:hypothetical protein
MLMRALLRLSDSIERGRGDIASVITQIAVYPLSCAVQAIITALVLQTIGVEDVRLGLGGLIFRCGERKEDFMAYCDVDGLGFRCPKDGILYGHCFNLVGSDVVDMSLHDLHHDLTHLRLTDGAANHPQNLTVSLPQYFWGPGASVRGKPHLPAPGKFVITPYKGAETPFDFIRPNEREFINFALTEIAPQVAELRRRYELKELHI